ncbi:MAG: gliding motility-associated C-terminal domain-containing protein, partial [Bacteroidota bacterium]
LDVVQGNLTSYRDTKTTLDQPLYCYRVTALELGGNRAESRSNEACVQVETGLQIANAFTPNEDGVNDIFLIQGIHIQNFNLKIFSRWGHLLFETSNINQGWDGVYRGKKLDEGVYTYVVSGRGYNGQPYLLKGTITLLR